MSNYEEEQKKRANKLMKDDFFGEMAGEGYTLNKIDLNLWTDIRKDVFYYFEKNNIEWSDTETDKKKHSANLLSSQIACINHLFPLRKREDMSTALLKNIDSRIKKAIKIDGGFIKFMISISQKDFSETEYSYLAHYDMFDYSDDEITSLDAIMVGEKEDGRNILFLFEWKYTDGIDDKKTVLLNDKPKDMDANPSNQIKEYSFWVNIYKNEEERNLVRNIFVNRLRARVSYELGKGICELEKSINIKAMDSEKKDKNPLPIVINTKDNKEAFDFDNELFYRLLKQTLWALMMIEAGKYKCDEYIHLCIIPEKNNQLRDACKKWKRLLTYPEEYKVISPQELFKPLEQTKDISELIAYLKRRYW